MSETSTSVEVQGINALMISLDALQPAAERTTSAKFAALHDNIEQALARGVTQRAVIDSLELNGLKVHPAKFKKLLDDARTQRDDRGIRCPACGADKAVPPLPDAQIDKGDEK